MRLFLLCLAFLLPIPAFAQSAAEVTRDALERHILPRFEALSGASEALAKSAQADCNPDSPALRTAYNDAFDAWIAASHLRFGPSETDERGFALAFWPDERGFTPRTLRNMIAEADPAVESAKGFAHVSIAARGFYALEFMLYDDEIKTMGKAAYRCALLRAITGDIARLSAAILSDWQGSYAAAMMDPGDTSPYRSAEEALQELFKSLTYGLEFTADTRLGRPLGTVGKPRPKRAEAWRAGRSLRNVVLSLASLQELAAILAERTPVLAEALDNAFRIALSDAEQLDDPIFAGVVDPLKRLRVESLRQSIGHVREIVRDDLGPALGVASGFNAMDGD